MFENAIQSKNTYSSVFSALDTEQFKLQCVDWIKPPQALLGEVVAIDGQTLCNSTNNNQDASAIHIISAFSTIARLPFPFSFSLSKKLTKVE